jgi:hypothetical protein
MPGTPVGGCAAVTETLADFIVERGVYAPMVVSDAGPGVTRSLLGEADQVALDDGVLVPKAAGMKLHIVSDRSLIPHNGIMLCLDTRRISGMVEVSRAVPSVAPPGCT